MNPLRWLFRRRRIERDLDTEIRSHFEMAIAERIAAGEDPESARLAAINEFGNALQAKEDAREVWRGGVVAHARRCLAGRALRHPHAGQEPRLLAGRDRACCRSALPATPRSSACSRGSRSSRCPASRDSATAGGAAEPHDRRPRRSACRCPTIATSRNTHQAFETLTRVDR